MSSVPEAVSLASGKAQLFDVVLWFLPEWAQLTVAGLLILLVVVSWILRVKRKVERRRAVRSSRPGPAGPGAQSGADFLGPYAPSRSTGEPVGTAADGPRGADFLGSYAPRRDSSA